MKTLINSVLFYLGFVLVSIFLLPWAFVVLYIFKDRRMLQCLGKTWTCATLTLARRLVGINYNLQGFDKIHKNNGPMIIASKHQSLWETFVFEQEFAEQSVFILKKELRKVPIFGRASALMGMIFIDRKKPVQAIRQMLNAAQKEVRENDSHVIIFPEGRRTAIGEKADYTDGVYLLYKNLDVPVAAIALNSGLFWPRRQFIKYPGTISAKVVEIIPPGLSRDQFRERLINAIENGSLELISNQYTAQPIQHVVHA